MRVLPSSLLCLLAFLFFGGCLYRTEDEAPIVYQGWHARYHYDVDKRRLKSTFGNKQIGRIWGRSEKGLIDYDRWWGGGPFVTENLLIARRAEGDLEREKRWKEAEQAMFDARLKAIEAEAGMESSKPETGEGGEETESGEPLPFEPEPFTPAVPEPEDAVLPMPLPVGPDPGNGLPPLPGGVGDSATPSPFPPLPGMQPEPVAPSGDLPPLPGGGGPTPSPFTPLGAKGAAEGNCMSTPVCLANAVSDALGKQDIVVPLTPAKISELIHGPELPPPKVRGEPTKIGTKTSLTGKGEIFVPKKPDGVWETLLNPKTMAKVIPGCHQLDLISEHKYRAEVSLGVGPVRGRFIAHVNLLELRPPHSMTLAGNLEGPLGATSGSGKLSLNPYQNGTMVVYDYNVDISGKVAAVGGRMLEGAAKIVVQQFFDRLIGQENKISENQNKNWFYRLLTSIGLGK